MIGLRWWRRARGMTQAELALRSGVSRETISRIETGKHLDPEVHTLAKLCEALDVSIFDLFVGPASLARALTRTAREWEEAAKKERPGTSPPGVPPGVGGTPAPQEHHEQEEVADGLNRR
jgi:transcriptional regulator with XRE-family HTH domain